MEKVQHNCDQMEEFKRRMKLESLSNNTISTYLHQFGSYLKWFQETYNLEFSRLYKSNILEYINYLKNIKKAGNEVRALDAKTINVKISAIAKYRELMEPDNLIDIDSLYINVQTMAVTPVDITPNEIEQFRQKVLQSEERNSQRNYAIITMMMYAGLRISEVLNIKNEDIDLDNAELRIRNGKGEKQRIVILNQKIIDAIKEYKAHSNPSEIYLFEVSCGKKINKSTINRVFNKYSNVITPHTLRHYFCATTLGSGWFTLNEVAAMAGHKDQRTTLKYANPSKSELKHKLDML